MGAIQFRVKGKVQGVFFRRNVRQKALELELGGYACNLADGTVEVVAVGSPERIHLLEEFIHSNPGAAKITAIVKKEIPGKKYLSFEIN